MYIRGLFEQLPFSKSSENVLMNLEMEIEGIYVDGKIVKIVAEK